MGNKIVFGAIALGLAAFVYSMTLAPAPAVAADGKNLQVLNKNLSKKEIKTLMKAVAKATGKSCDDCHDLEDFGKDTPMKSKARKMFKMTNTVNARLKKDGFKKRVKCVTCHDGKGKPAK